MRLVPLLALTLVAGSAFAEDAKPAAPATAINTVCPVGGDKVDPKLAPIAAKTTDGKEVMIGICCAGCDKAIAKEPAAYADAAVANRKHVPKPAAEKAAEAK